MKFLIWLLVKEVEKHVFFSPLPSWYFAQKKITTIKKHLYGRGYLKSWGYLNFLLFQNGNRRYEAFFFFWFRIFRKTIFDISSVFGSYRRYEGVKGTWHNVNYIFKQLFGLHYISLGSSIFSRIYVMRSLNHLEWKDETSREWETWL